MLNTRVNSRLLSQSTFCPPTDYANQLPSSSRASTHQRTSRIAYARVLPAFGESGTDHCRLIELAAVPVGPFAVVGRNCMYNQLIQHLRFNTAFNTSVQKTDVRKTRQRFRRFLDLFVFRCPNIKRSTIDCLLTGTCPQHFKLLMTSTLPGWMQ